MRASAWVAMMAVGLAWLACIGWPAVAAVEQLLRLQSTQAQTHSLASLLMTSMVWAVAVAAAAMIVGWVPGRVLGKSLAGPRSSFIPLAVLMLAPICLPAYVVFYAWWQSWPVDTAFHKWVVARDLMQWARQGTLFVGLVCWSWPLVSWCVAGFSAAMPGQHEEMLLLDGSGRLRRLAHHLRQDARGLALGGLIVFLATLANTTCFDLAEVFTFSNELRAIQALDANLKDVMIAAWPAVALSGLGAVIVWRLLSRGGVQRQPPMRVRPPGAWSAAFVSALWTCSVVVPLALFAWNLFSESSITHAREFFALYRWSLVNTVLYAAGSAVAGAVLALALAAVWMTGPPWASRAAGVLAITWALAALLPGTFTGAALLAAYNRPVLDAQIAMTPAILTIGHLACFGFIAVLMARWTARREPDRLRDMRRLDGGDSIVALMQTNRPRLLAAAWATFAIIFVLALGEIPVTAVVNPPYRTGAGPLSLTLLNDMHYQRPQTVMVASLLMILAALAAAIIVTTVWIAGVRQRSALQKPTTPLIALLGATVMSIVLAGCTPDDPDSPMPLKPQLVFGKAGTGLGQFAYPRAIDLDPVNEFLFIIDKQGRVQRFGFDGKPQLQWRMPEYENGKPTGVSVSPDGRVFVADTHYFRVMVYDAGGQELMRFGELGRGPGQFIYVTDVAFGPHGRLYVSEYGGNDRVQVFDASGKYLFEFASFGAHGRLNRPQALAFTADHAELYIADACNHRIVVVAPDGRFLREFGMAGRGAGQLTYPYGLVVLGDGSVLVAEFGNNRLQRFDPHGTPLGIYGSIGREPGQLQYPWGLAATRDRIFVLDSGNNRVQVIRNFSQ